MEYLKIFLVGALASVVTAVVIHKVAPTTAVTIYGS
jgi:hypothetical protein